MDKNALNDLIDNAEAAKIKVHLLNSWVEINGMEDLKSGEDFLTNSSKTDWTLVKKMLPPLEGHSVELLEYLNNKFPDPDEPPK